MKPNELIGLCQTDPEISGIYLILCVPSNKCYIGQSNLPRRRFIRHRTELNMGKHSNNYLQRAWDKYGKDSFIFQVIENCPITELGSKESDYANLIDKDFLYNLRSIESDQVSWSGKAFHSDNARKRISEARRGKSLSEETKQKIRMTKLGKSRKVTQAERDRIRIKPNSAVITLETALLIKECLLSGNSIHDTAILYGVTYNIVAHISNETSWKHLWS